MPHPLAHPRARRTLRAVLVGTTAALAVGLGTASASAATVGPLVKVSKSDPFAKCNPGNPGVPPGTNYPSGEVEPYVVVDPSDPNHLAGGSNTGRT